MYVHINTILYIMRSTGIPKQTETRDMMEVIQRQIVGIARKKQQIEPKNGIVFIGHNSTNSINALKENHT